MNLSVLIDSSGELAFIYAIGFIISLYLIHLISIQIWMRKLFVPWFVTK
jgi:hypothetical protein